MILDVARHKFSEGILIVATFAFVASLCAGLLFAATPDQVAYGAAPLSVAIQEFALLHPVLCAILLFPMLIYSAVRLSRATVRVGIYTVSTLAALSLAAISIFAVTMSQHFVYLTVVAWLMSEVLGRLFYCFGPNTKPNSIFTSMLALGAMPLVDCALIPLVILLALVFILLRGTLRETLIVLLGLLLPSFVYCYVAWWLGGEFNEAFLAIWANFEVSQHSALVEYLSLSRLIFIGVMLFFQLWCILFYVKDRVMFSDVAHTVWRALLFLLFAHVVLLLLYPAASPAILVVMVLMTTVMLPQFFISVDGLIGAIAYVVLIASAFGAMF